MSRTTHTLRWLLFAAAMLLAMAAVVLPPGTMSWLRQDYAWVGRPLLWPDSASTARFDMTHVALFGGITWLLACLWPRVPGWRLALFMLALGVATELLQFGVPGRTPKVADVVDDFIGVCAGLALALPLRWVLWRQARP